jgi:DNA-nicking Smr family endonuclease
MRQDARHHTAPQQPESRFGHRPFQELQKLTINTRVVAPAPPAASAPPSDPEDTPLFLHAVADVRPLDARARERVAGPPPANPARPVTPPDAEALAELCDLVNGHAPFDITSSDDYIEGAAVGLDPRLLRRLRAGEFAYQAHLDLHGMVSDEARGAVEAFLTHAYQSGKRCVLIVHGRGRNSKDQIPVLKSRLTTWLGRGRWARLILAFTSARPCDGGAGALYVLLRRDRRTKRPFRITAGAKW